MGVKIWPQYYAGIPGFNLNVEQSNPLPGDRGMIRLNEADAIQVRDALIEAYPLATKPDDLAAANAMNEPHPFHTFDMGATVSKDDVAMAKEAFEQLNSRLSEGLAQKQAAEEIARLRDKVKRLKRALKGALK